MFRYFKNERVAPPQNVFLARACSLAAILNYLVVSGAEDFLGYSSKDCDIATFTNLKKKQGHYKIIIFDYMLNYIIC